MPLVEAIRALIDSNKTKYQPLYRLVNEIIQDETDFEHIITFLDESPSALHRQFAEDLRFEFAKVLRTELREIEKDLGKERYQLYSALLDMYSVEGCPEVLGGMLSINYDEYIEAAAESVYGEAADYGLTISGNSGSARNFTLIKLHGSFNWKHTWPVEHSQVGAQDPLWIPPGIQKGKERYPFNVLWGKAREMLNCDVLRIIGCRLSGNDWDLISLLFATRHTHANRKVPYVVEIIDSPKRAFELKREYPYLDVKSIYEIDDLQVGAHFVSEFFGGAPRPYSSLSDGERKRLESLDYSGRNWFHLWLAHMAEAFVRELEDVSIKTSSGQFEKMLEEA